MGIAGSRVSAADVDPEDFRFDRVEGELGRINDRLDGIQHSLVYGLVAMICAFLAASGGVIATQL
jgi:hypothetical protein